MKAKELESRIAAVRRELACALDEYRELGLRVSLLSKQRNIARQNLARTEQYLQSVQPGAAPLRGDRHAAPETAPGVGARVSPRQARVARAARRSDLRRKPRWRRAVDTITSHALPARQLEQEFRVLQQQLAASRDECKQLEEHAGRLERARDQALADLELARARALSVAEAAPGDETPVKASAPAAPPREAASVSDALRAVEEKLQRAQLSSNDIQIALAERVDQVAALQSELRALRDDSDRSASRDAEQIAALQQRIGEIQEELEGARARSEALEHDLEAAAARQAETDQQREQLAQALETERNSSTAREQQLSELQAAEAQLRGEIEVLAQRLSGVEQELGSASETNRALEQEMQALVDEYAVSQRRDAQRIEDLEHDLEAGAARQAETDQQYQQLTETIAEERGNSAARERELADLQLQDEQRRYEIDNLTQQLAAAKQELDAVTAGFRSAEDTLRRVQAEKNDSDIALVEREDEIAALQRRIGEIETELESARERSDALDRDLQAAIVRQAETEQQRGQLAEALETERHGSAAREQQLAELLAQDEERGTEIKSLIHQVAAASQHVDTVTAALTSAEEKLHHAQLARNDMEISLAERDEQVTVLQSEREGLQTEIEQLNARLSSLQQDLATAQQFNQVLTSELDAARDELHRTGSRDGEQIAALNRRIAGIEAELEGARGSSQALEADLQAALASQRDIEQQRQQLAEALETERSNGAVRDQQLAQLQARDEQRGAEIDSLNRQLLAAAQEHETVSSENRSLAQQLDTLASESESARSRDQRRLDELQQRLAESEPARDAALQRVEALETALAEASAALLAGEKRREALAVALQAQKNRLDERGRQLAALEADRQQRTAEAYELKRRVSAAEQSRTQAQQETQALKPELDELVAQLKSLQAALETAEARVAEAEQRRQALSDELFEERSRVAAREQQISELQAREQRLQAELEALAERLSGVEQELVSSHEKNRSLEQDKQAAVDEYVATRHRDRGQILTLEHRLAELEPQLAAAHKQVEDLQLSLAEAAYRQELSDKELAQLGAQLERVDQAPQSAAQTESPAPVSGPVEPAPQAVQLIPGKALQPVAATTVPVKRHRRRGWARVAAGLVLVVGVVVGAIKLRDLLWQDQVAGQLGKDSEPRTSEPAPETVVSTGPGADSVTPDANLASVDTATGGAKRATETTPTQVAVAEPPTDMPTTVPGVATKKPKQMVPYLRSLPGQATDQTVEPTPEPAAVAEAPGSETADTPGAETDKTKTVPFWKVVRRPSGKQKGAGVHVEAYLMEDAASGRALDKLCEGGADAGQRCSETEKGFMKDTVVALPSGVKYKVIRNGIGRSPQAGDEVVVNYRAMLPDGTEFDSTGPGGESEAFRLSQAIPGLQDVLQYMEEGAKWEVYVPTELAFPEPGPLGGQEVIFVIELLAVLDPQGAPIATGQADDDTPLPARPPSGEESYWQTVTGGESGEADAEQDSGSGPVRPSPLRQRAETAKFLAENAMREGVVSLPSGLQYRVLKSGDGSGRSPGATDTVVLKYRGTLPDGREFDRSEGAAEFSLEEVIPGWQEALQQMEEGAEWELVIPPSLAHRGATRKRGAFGQQPLIYEVELVSINASSATPADQ